MKAKLRLGFECTVADAGALWDAAALRATTDYGMTLEDVVETIGPREDPEIEACATMLLDAIACKSGIFETITVTTLALTTETLAHDPPTSVAASGVSLRLCQPAAKPWTGTVSCAA